MRAVSFVDRLVQAAERLRGNPAMGRVIPEFAHPDLRELILGNYRIVYHLKNDVVTVLRVVHGTRDLKELVRREPWEV